MKSPRLSLIAALLAAAVSACSNTPETAEKPAEKKAEEAKPAQAVAKKDEGKKDDATTRSATAQTGAAKGGAVKPLESIGAPDKRSVYFDFDKYDIRDEFKGVVTDHTRFVSQRKDAKMLIQGNADERGSREYNLALGQRRADAVKKSMLLQGAKEEQIESVSLGEEKPKASGHDEAAWAENRRADILYKGEY